MMAAGFVDLSVRYRDIFTGRNVSVDYISGIVRNSRGLVIESITPLPYTDVDGAYYSAVDYDVRDASKFPGAFLTVEWTAYKMGIALPLLKHYDYQPVSEDYADKTLLYWLPLTPPGSAYFYEVHRTRNDGTDELAGRSFGSSFVDAYPFDNEFEARAWLYKMKPFRRTGAEGLQPDGSDLISQGTALEPYLMFRTSAPVCSVTGRLTDVGGRPIFSGEFKFEMASVVFKVNRRDRWQIVGDTLFTNESLYAGISESGRFTIDLIQDCVVEMWIPFMNFAARFIVPRKSLAGLSELNLEILRE
jgi:hypothetical protein